MKPGSGNIFASCSVDCSVKIWDLKNKEDPVLHSLEVIFGHQHMNCKTKLNDKQYFNVPDHPIVDIFLMAYKQTAFDITFFLRFLPNGASLYCKENLIYVLTGKKPRGLVPISTFMFLRAIYIFPRSISWEYINRSQKHECRNLD